MTRKTFLWNFKKQAFINKNAVNTEIFSKFLVRDHVESNKRLRLIDNGSEIFDIITTKKAIKKWKPYYLIKKEQKKKKKQLRELSKLTPKQRSKRKIWLKKLKALKKLKKKTYLAKKRKRIGAYINVEKQILKHKFWDKVRLNIPVISTSKNKTTVLKLRNCINRLALSKAFNKEENLPVRVLKPKKGGFIVRFSVIKGFLPRKQFIKAKNALIIDFSEKNKKLANAILKFKKEFAEFNDHFSTLKKTILLSKNNKKKNRNLVNIFKKKLSNYKKNISLLQKRKSFFIHSVNKLNSLKKIKKNTIRLPLKLDFLNYKSPNKRAGFVKKRWWYKRKKLKITKKGMLKRPIFYFQKTDYTKPIYKNLLFRPFLLRAIKNYEFKQNNKKSKLFVSTKRNYNN
jgi:hypothetical protein